MKNKRDRRNERQHAIEGENAGRTKLDFTDRGHASRFAFMNQPTAR